MAINTPSLVVLPRIKKNSLAGGGWEENVWIHAFPKGFELVSPSPFPTTKVNVIARLEYELAYYDSVVDRFNHHATRTSRHFFFTGESTCFHSMDGFAIQSHSDKPIFNTIGKRLIRN